MTSRAKSVSGLVEDAGRLLFPTESYDGLSIARGDGSRFEDHDGRQFVDFGAALACLPFGYAFGPTLAIIRAQAGKLLHSGSEIINEESLALLAEFEVALPGYAGFYCNSGTEANEAALKLARRHAISSGSHGKSGIVAMRNSFHGRSLLSISASGNEQHTEGFHPLVPGNSQVPFNDVERLLDQVDASTCAIIVETVQARGGGNEISTEFVNALHDLRDRHGCLIIVDDVQTGLGRLGTTFGFEGFALDPDIITLAKGLGGGLPIGLTLARREIATSMNLGSHGSTFGGNPLATAVALDIFARARSGETLAGVRDRATRFVSALKVIDEELHCFTAIRGRGLLLNVELSGLWAKQASSVKLAAANRGLFIRTSGSNFLRFTPALNIPHDDLDVGMEMLRDALAEMIIPSRLMQRRGAGKAR